MASENGSAVPSEPADRTANEVMKKPVNGETTLCAVKQEASTISANVGTPSVDGRPVATKSAENGEDESAMVKEKEDVTKAMEKALHLNKLEGEAERERYSWEGKTPEIGGRAKWLERQREREEKNKRLSKQKDGSYFSYMFLEKIFRESRKCKICGARNSGKPLADDESSLELYISEKGVCGRQRIICSECGGIEPVISCETMAEIPDKPEFRIDGSTVRYYCKKITHYELLHDLMELLHIAALENDKARKQKHLEVAEFILHNARKICKEWCKPESTELRQKKFLRLREETLLVRHKPVFTSDHNDEYKEMYHMMAGSFRQHREKVKLLLELLKTTLFDNPTQSTFMVWVSIAMMHAENYQKFKSLYDPKTFMQVDSTEYQALKDRYLTLNVALGIKKIPIVFILFELPRFYHYIEFLKERVGKDRPTSFLTEEDRRTLEKFDRQARKYVMKRKVKSGKLVSAESHLDLLTQQEEMDREMMYRSSREKERAKLEERKRQDEKKRLKKVLPRRGDTGRLALEAPVKGGSGSKEDEGITGGGILMTQRDASLDDCERKRRDEEQYWPPNYDYLPFRRHYGEILKEKSSLDKDLVAEKFTRKPYRSRIELLIEEEDREWGPEGKRSRKDVLLAEEDILFERKVSMRFNKPEKSVLDTIPVSIELLPISGKAPTQGQVLALLDKLFALEIDPFSFDCVHEMAIQVRKREEELRKKAAEIREAAREKRRAEMDREDRERERRRAMKDGESVEDEQREEAVVAGDGQQETAEVGSKEGEEGGEKVEVCREESVGKEVIAKENVAEHASVATPKQQEDTALKKDEEKSEMEGMGEAEEAAAVGLNDSNDSLEYVEAKEELEPEELASVVESSGDSTPQPSSAETKNSTAQEKEETVAEKTSMEEESADRGGAETAAGETRNVAAEEEASVERSAASTSEETEEARRSRANLKVSEELTALTEAKEWSPQKVEEVMNRVKSEHGLADEKYVDMGEDFEAALKFAFQHPTRTATVSGSHLAALKPTSAPSQATPNGSLPDLNPEEEELVNSLTDICLDYLHTVPRLHDSAAASVSENSDEVPLVDTLPFKGDDKMVAMVTKVSDDVMVAIVTARPDAFRAQLQAMDFPGLVATPAIGPSPSPTEHREKPNVASSESNDVPSAPAKSESTLSATQSSAGKTSEGEEGDQEVKTESSTKKEEKKPLTKKRSKKIEKQAKQLVESVQRRKAREERYWHSRALKRTESQEALDRLMEKRDCTLDQLSMEEKRVLMDHVRKSKMDPYHSDWDRRMLTPSYRAQAGPLGMRSRLRQKLNERRREDDYSPPPRPPRSYRKSEESRKVEPKTADPLKSKRKSKHAAKAETKIEDTPKVKPKTKAASSSVNKSTSSDSLPSVQQEASECRTEPSHSPSEVDSEKKLPPLSGDVNGVKEKLDKLSMEASLPKTEPMKPKVSEPSKKAECSDKTQPEKVSEKPQAKVSEEPQPKESKEPQPKLSEKPQPEVSKEPKPIASEKQPRVEEPQPKTSEEPQLKVSEEPQPKVSEEPQPKLSEELQQKVSEEPQPKVSEEPQQKVLEEPQQKVSEEPQQKVNEEPQPKTSEEVQPKVSEEPQLKTSENPVASEKKLPTPCGVSAAQQRSLEMARTAKVPAMTMSKKLEPIKSHPQDKPQMLSVGSFRSMLVDQLKANERAVSGLSPILPPAPPVSAPIAPTPKMRATVSSTANGAPLKPKIPLPVPSCLPATASPLKMNKKQRKDARKLLRKQQRQLLVAQVDTQLLREQGFKVKENSTTTTVICNTDGGIEQVLDGVESPEQIKEFLGGRYNVVSQGTGYLSVPGGEESDDSETEGGQKSIEASKPKLETASSTTWDVDSDDDSGDGLSGFPLTSTWRKDKRDKFKKTLMKGLGKAIPIEKPLAMRKAGPPKDELEELEAMEEKEQEELEKAEKEREMLEGKESRKKQRKERKKAEKLKKEEEAERERLKTEAKRREVERLVAERRALMVKSDVVSKEPKQAVEKPKDITIDPSLDPFETLGRTPLQLTGGLTYVALRDMEDVETKNDLNTISPGTFIYKASVPAGGSFHPFREVYKFARKRTVDLVVAVEVSEVYCSKNFDKDLELYGKPRRISYNCRLNVCELKAPCGELDAQK